MLTAVSSKNLSDTPDRHSHHQENIVAGVRIPLLERSIAMTRFGVSTTTTSQRRARVLRWSFAFILCLGTFMGMSSTTLAGNRCKDHCNDVYKVEKRACKAIPLKRERHSCENA